MKQYKAIIIDDEPVARDFLNDFLSEIPEIKVVDMQCDADSGFDAILKYKPDIIFLDIEMPGGNGLELAKMLRKEKISVRIVFVTAFNQYAIEAFKVAAFDYLLKPIAPEDLSSIINKLKHENNQASLINKIDKLLETLSSPKIRFNTRTGFVLLNASSIVYCNADGSYTYVYLDSGKMEYVTKRLGEIENQLDTNIFIRISRSILVNKNFIHSLNRNNRSIKLTSNQMEEIEFIASKSGFRKLKKLFE